MRLEVYDQERARNPALVCFKAVDTDETYEEIIEYITILDRVEKVDGEDSEWHFNSIDVCKEPLKTTYPAYRGSMWNVRLMNLCQSLSSMIQYLVQFMQWRMDCWLNQVGNVLLG